MGRSGEDFVVQPSRADPHGGLDQNTRTSIFNRFKQGRIRLLIATDVAGRGLDFSHVSHIFNYDFPKASENYVHRTGRTGRMGRVGVAISLVTARDLFTVKRLLKEKGIQAAWDGTDPALAAYKGWPAYERLVRAALARLS